MTANLFGIDQEGSTASTTDPAEGSVQSGAHFSPDRLYRYTLWRVWYAPRPRLIVIGLNPSTADETENDPTIRRCIAFAKREGLGGLCMLNIFAFRATDPRVMFAASDPVGPENDAILRRFADTARDMGDVMVAAWGVHGAHRGRARDVAALIPGLRCFGVTKDGHPRHPLYLRADTPLVPYPHPEMAPVPAVDPSRSTPNAVLAARRVPEEHAP